MRSTLCRRLTVCMIAAVSIMVFNFMSVVADTSYPVWICGVQVTDTNNSGKGWTCEVKDNKATLTLDNFNYTSSGVVIKSNIDLTIVLNGKSRMDTLVEDCIIVTGSLVIKGDGALEVDGTMNVDGDVTICDVSMLVNSLGNEKGKYGVYLNNTLMPHTLSIRNSKVTFKGNKSAVYGEIANVFISDDSKVDCYVQKDGICIKANSLSVDKSYLSVDEGEYGLKVGTVSLKNGSHFKAMVDHVGAMGHEFVTENSIVNIDTRYPDDVGLYFSRKMEFVSGMISIDTKNGAVYSESGGITIGEKAKIVIPENGSVSSDGKYIVGRNPGSSAKEVEINGTFSVNVNSNDTKSLVSVDKENALPNSKVNVVIKPDSSHEFEFKNLSIIDGYGREVSYKDEGNGVYSFEMPAQIVTVNVEFEELGKYPVWVGGVQVTDKNNSGKGWTCEVKDSKATLTLNEMDLDYKFGEIIKSDLDLTVVLIGNNRLNAISAKDCIFVNGSLEIKGDGSLFMYGGLKGNGDITIYNTGVVHITPCEYGICLVKTVPAHTLTIKNRDVSIAAGTGNKCAINADSGKIVISDGSKVLCQLSEDGVGVLADSLSIEDTYLSISGGTTGLQVGSVSVKDGSLLCLDSHSVGAVGHDFVTENSIIDIRTGPYGDTVGLDFSNRMEFLSGAINIESRTTRAVYSENGRITLGENMRISFPVDGYVSSDGKDVIDKEIGLPAKDVYISGTFHVYVNSNDTKSLVSVDKTDAKIFEPVKITIKPDSSHELEFRKLSIIDGYGKQISYKDEGNGVYSFEMPGQIATVNVEFEEAEQYPVWIEGQKLTSFYTSGEGWSFEGNAEGGKLTLDNADLTGDETAIYSEIPLTVVLKGENKLTAEGYGILAKSSLTFELDGGSLDATGKKAAISSEQGKILLSEKLTIATPESGKISDDGRSIFNSEGKIATNVVIKEAPKPTTALKVTLKLDKKSASVICGKTTTIKATLTGSKDKISWKSSDTKIATVDANGKVTAKMAGTVTITASAAGKSAKCTVTVLYKDVTNSSDFWFAPTNYLTAKGIVKGYANQTEFRPANDCTRAQMVTFLYRLQGEPKTQSDKCKFSDVKSSDYFFKPVIWATEKGITTGSNGKFNPQGICTRAQTVTFLYRMAGSPSIGSAKCPFKDVRSSDYFYKPVIWAYKNKIVADSSDGSFKPQGKCLRRQMVTFLYKYDKYVNGKG